MPIMFTDSGAMAMLTKYFGNVLPTGGNDFTVRLFTNDVTMSDDLTAGSFTEANGGGYAAATIAPADIAISAVGGIVQAAIPQKIFEFTGALTGNPSIYGYYVVDDDGVLIFADKASGAYTPSSAGDIYAVTPTFQLSKGTPT